MKIASARRIHADRVATDTELFTAIARGDLGPLGVLFDRYHEDVRQFVARASSDDMDVDDIVQEAFLTAARIAEAYDGRGSARPFLIGIAAQLLRRRRRSFARVCSLFRAFGDAPVTPARTPEEAMSSAEEQEIVRAAVAHLPDDLRLVLVMVEYSGMSGVDAAKALDKPPGTVWRWLHEARTELRRALTKGKR
jgi:RNA polymerase sigma-70 factor (ECF subfamily)